MDTKGITGKEPMYLILMKTALTNEVQYNIMMELAHGTITE